MINPRIITLKPVERHALLARFETDQTAPRPHYHHHHHHHNHCFQLRFHVFSAFVSQTVCCLATRVFYRREAVRQRQSGVGGTPRKRAGVWNPRGPPLCVTLWPLKREPP